MARLIKPDGNSTDLPELDLSVIQAAVGGYFEVVALTSNLMLVNEEGLLLNLPMNPVASSLAGKTIVGNAILCSHNELK